MQVGPPRSDCSRAGCGPGAGSSGGADSGRHHCEPGSSGDCVTSFRHAGESSRAVERRIDDDRRVDEIRRPARLPLPADGRARERAGGLVRAPSSRGRLGADRGHRQAGALSPRSQETPPPVRTLRTRSPEPGRALRAAAGRVATARAPTTRRSASSAAGRRSTACGDWSATTSMFPTPSRRGSRSRSPALAGPCERRAARSCSISTSVPYSAHLAALAVARSERVPWVAELRDPWTLIDDRFATARARERRSTRRSSDGGRLGERGRGHLRADAGGDGPAPTLACLPSLGGQKRIRAVRRPGAGAAGQDGPARARSRGIGRIRDPGGAAAARRRPGRRGAAGRGPLADRRAARAAGARRPRASAGSTG